MIFKRSLLQELFSSVLANLQVPLGIMVTQRITYTPGYETHGDVASDAIKALQGYSTLRFLPLLLTLTLFVAVLIVLSRCHLNSEMVVWFTSGKGLYALIQPLLSIALSVIAIIALPSPFLAPWATRKGNDDFREQMASKDKFSTLAPEVFKESKNAARLYFVEIFSALQNKVNNINAQSMQHQKPGILIAKEGSQSTEKMAPCHLPV
jgi:lipopolysaccharide export system permease protein